MDVSYVLTPFLAWFVAGCLKFAVNSARTGAPAFGQIGYGGLPSNHASIVSSMATLIALREGVSHSVFGVALTLAFIVILDAGSLRRQVGRQAEAINRLGEKAGEPEGLRERMGHSKVELGAGVLVGSAVAYAIYKVGGSMGWNV